MHPNLRTFLDLLARENDLVTIEAEVDPYLEAAEIHRRVIERGGPALLFKRVKGSRYPVVTNLFGTKRRIELAFGPKPEAIVREMVQVAESLLPPRPSELWKHRALGVELLRIGTRNTSVAPVRQVLDQPARLDELPVLTTWDEDGGPFITLPLVYTENPVTKKHNLGIYRMQVYDAQTTGLHWQIQKGGGFHYTRSRTARTAVAGDRISWWSACSDTCGDCSAAGRRSRAGAGVVAGGREVEDDEEPADGVARIGWRRKAEFALVGKAPPHKRRLEGPFGDHYGYYSLEHEYPVFEVDAVFHRRDAIYPGDGGWQTSPGRFFHRRLSTGVVVAAVSAGDAWRSRPMDLWRDRISFAVRRGGPGALWTRGIGFGFPYPGRRSAFVNQVFDAHRHATGPSRFPATARTRAGAFQSRNRPFHLFKRFDGHARLHEREG